MDVVVPTRMPPSELIFVHRRCRRRCGPPDFAELLDARLYWCGNTNGCDYQCGTCHKEVFLSDYEHLQWLEDPTPCDFHGGRCVLVEIETGQCEFVCARHIHSNDQPELEHRCADPVTARIYEGHPGNEDKMTMNAMGLCDDMNDDVSTAFGVSATDLFGSLSVGTNSQASQASSEDQQSAPTAGGTASLGFGMSLTHSGLVIEVSDSDGD